MTITSPEVRANPDWTAGVTKASLLYQQASDIIAERTASGTSRLLADLSATAAAATPLRHRLRHLRPRQRQHRGHIHRNRKRDGRAMPINPNTFGAPPAPTAPPPHSRPPGPPAPLPPPLSDASQGRKRWPGILAGAATGALVATLTAAMITTQAHDSGNAATTASTTTRTVAAPTPPNLRRYPSLKPTSRPATAAG